MEVTEQELGVIRALLARIEFLELLDKIGRLGRGSYAVGRGKCSRMALACRFEDDRDEDGEATGESENAGNAVISVVFARIFLQNPRTAMAYVSEGVSACSKAAKSTNTNEEGGVFVKARDRVRLVLANAVHEHGRSPR